MIVGAPAMVKVAGIARGLVLSPGPNMVYLVSRPVTQGPAAGLVSLLGVAAGFGVYRLAATAGIVTLFALVPGLYTVVKIGGAGYLLWLAWKAVRPGWCGVSGRRLGALLPVEQPSRLVNPQQEDTMGKQLVQALVAAVVAALFAAMLTTTAVNLLLAYRASR